MIKNAEDVTLEDKLIGRQGRELTIMTITRNRFDKIIFGLTGNRVTSPYSPDQPVAVADE